MGLARLTLLALAGSAVAAAPAPAAPLAGRSATVVGIRAGGIALDDLGRGALRALDRGDPDRFAGPLGDLIEGRRLLRATPVRLDFRDATMAEVAESLGEQAGVSVVVGAGEALRGRRVTLQSALPVTFWEAIDRLEAAVGVRHDPGASYAHGVREPTVVLGFAEWPPVPSSHSGPFRVHLVRLSSHRSVSPSRETGVATPRESLVAELHVFAEPGLVAWPIGPARLDEAIDDRGDDLRPDPLAEPDPARRRVWPPRFDQGHSGAFALAMPLDPAAVPGGRLRRVRGSVPVGLLARSDDPIVVPLDEAEGGKASRGTISLDVSGFDREGDATCFTLTIAGEQTERPPLLPGPPVPDDESPPPYRVEDHVQIRDERGQILWWNAGSLRGLGGEELEARVTVYDGQGGAPAQLLYYEVEWAATEVPFEFDDVPLP